VDSLKSQEWPGEERPHRWADSPRSGPLKSSQARYVGGRGAGQGGAKKALATISTEGEHIVSRGSANEAMIAASRATGNPTRP